MTVYDYMADLYPEDKDDFSLGFKQAAQKIKLILDDKRFGLGIVTYHMRNMTRNTAKRISGYIRLITIWIFSLM